MFVEVAELEVNTRALELKMQLIGAVAASVATELEDDMRSRQYAKWTDRSGRARGGIHARSHVSDSGVLVEFGGTVPYFPSLNARYDLMDRITDKYTDVMKRRVADALNV